MSSLWLPIRTKISAALHAWSPLDPSAHTMILPWKGVWSALELEKFLQRTILGMSLSLCACENALYLTHVGKLYSVLNQGLTVSPANQDLSVFNAVMLWHDAFDATTFVVMICNAVRFVLAGYLLSVWRSV